MYRRNVRAQRSPYRFAGAMIPLKFLSDLLILVLFNIRKFHTLRRERRRKVADRDVFIWNRDIRMGIFCVVPVSARRIVSFKYMNIVACPGKFLIGNESTEGLN